MPTNRAHAHSATIIPFADARASHPRSFEARKHAGIDPLEEASCKEPENEQKSSKFNRETKAGSRIGYTVTHPKSCEACTHISDEELDDFVEQNSVRTLRKLFPHEHSSHTGMLARAKQEKAIVHDDLRPFKFFLQHLRQAPSRSHTVDRINTADLEYAPGKVRWATKAEQAQNRMTSITLPYKGSDLPLPQVAALTGQKPDTLRHRLRAGWRKEEAVAGTRTTGASLTNSGWPTGATPSTWDGPFKGWSACYGGKASSPATRAVFFCWIVGNRLAYLHRKLSANFPEWFSHDADPDDDSPLPQPVIESGCYQQYLLFQPMFEEAYAQLAQDRQQTMLLAQLRKHHRSVTEPRLAREAIMQKKR
ncbi:hypothetical protein [Sinorhizobium prairiense]|uniref:hypothetical protein n=1 Tax=unclassified Sinorhizobium TaxID=2613772 RepID=UPI0023D84512|nr:MULTISPECIES: hypothetical protein [unclassified Sinorhizobium]WEJ09299.1 hypothetical protein N0Q90_14410 [Sinorhizobium sp. M103]WEJ16158.1 hypothetical protein N0Q91_05905 [Sinorhizobium sp. K101]WEJ36264.1 hypothetical protein N0R80_14385 [Sinorhizobium sp. C101]